MNWKNLLKNKCPKCGRGTLQPQGEQVQRTTPRTDGEHAQEILKHLGFKCSGKKCDFRISEQRLREITLNMTSRRFQREYLY